MIILLAKFYEKTKAWSSKTNSTASSNTNSSPGSTQSKNTSRGRHHQPQCNAQATWWKIEPGLNLEIQVCHWKDEMKTLENDMKNAGIRATVWKWQAIQIWHRSAINSTRPPKCIKNNKLQYSNIETKYMARIHSRCLTKDEQWATANSINSRFKQAWQKCKW